MGAKPRRKPVNPAAFDTTDAGPYQLRLDMLRKDNKKIPKLCLASCSFKYVKGGWWELTLKAEFEDPEW